MKFSILSVSAVLSLAAGISAAPAATRTLFIPSLPSDIVADASIVETGTQGTMYAFSIVSGTAPAATGTLVEGASTAVLVMELASTTMQAECPLGTNSAVNISCGMVTNLNQSTSSFTTMPTNNAVFRVVNSAPAGGVGVVTKGIAILAAGAAGALAVLL